MKSVLAFVAGLWMILAFMAASFAISYFAQGYGLHPYLAAPIAALSVAMSVFSAHVGDLIEG